MTIEEIMAMAHKLHVYEPCSLVADAERRLNELFETIAAAEREACAKVCENQAMKSGPYPSHGHAAATMCAVDIRARSRNDA